MIRLLKTVLLISDFRLDTKTGHTIEFGIEPDMMVTEEANLWAHTAHQVIKPLGLAGPIGFASMSLEDHSGRRVVDEKYINPTTIDDRIDLVASIICNQSESRG